MQSLLASPVNPLQSSLYCPAAQSDLQRSTQAAEIPPTAQVSQTVQTSCWDQNAIVVLCAGTGLDGDIQAGAEWPDPRFTDNGNGTITANLTGLMWLQDANCSGMFRSRNLALADVAKLNTFQTMNANECENYTATFADWRIPNIRELLSLVDYEKTDGTLLPTPNDFINFQSDNYWSSTMVASIARSA